jgi:Zn-dependent peptidase ImmA (M78 family)/DNA-binding XRE family transcriptional regulator
MINGERVKQAREIRGYTQSQLAAVAGVHQSNIARLERNEFSPSDALLRALSIHLDFPVEFFQQESGPEFPLGSLLFRKRAKLKSQDRYKIRQLARLNYELMEVVSRRFATYDIRIPRLLESPQLAAKITRAALGYSPDTPVDSLTYRLEKSGVVVLSIPHPIDEHDAFSLWADSEPRRPVLVLTTGKPGDRQRFNLAHELGHLVLHQTFTGSIAMIEEEANLFAAEFLMPAAAIRREFARPVTLSGLAVLKKRWGVSIQALALRARDLQVISERQYKYLCQQINGRGWRKEEPVEVPSERPRLFRKMVEKIYGDSSRSGALADAIGAPTGLVKQILDSYAPAPWIRDIPAAPPDNLLTLPARRSKA